MEIGQKLEIGQKKVHPWAMYQNIFSYYEHTPIIWPDINTYEYNEHYLIYTIKIPICHSATELIICKKSYEIDFNQKYYYVVG